MPHRALSRFAVGFALVCAVVAGSLAGTEPARASLPGDVSILTSQVGYETEAQKRAILRSAVLPSPDPGGRQFQVLDADTGTVVHTGTVTEWGSKWGSNWWVADFSELRADGAYFVRVPDAAGDLDSSVFKIASQVLIDETLVTAAMDQLDARRGDPDDPANTRGKLGWRDSCCLIRELSSVTVALHGLADIHDNVLSRLSPANQDRLIDQVRNGADYLVAAQRPDGHFNHDLYPNPYATHDYYMWHDIAYAITGLVRAYEIVRTSDPATADTYLASARLAYDYAISRETHLAGEFAGPDGNQAEYVHKLARLYYDKPSYWTVPTTLRTKDRLTFMWAATLLFDATGEQKFRAKAIEFGDEIIERQFTNLDDPIDGAYGNFYEFEGDDDAFTVEWGQSHRWHMGNIEPTNLRGFINLVRQDPANPKVASWYNVVKTYAEHYVKATAELTPFGIYPAAVYRDPEHGGVKFFGNVLHGATGMYGQIAKNLLEIGEFLGDRTFHDLAANNAQFVLGLNPGIPTDGSDTRWQSTSLLRDIGSNSYAGSNGAGGPEANAPAGSGYNGFSSFPQFGEYSIGEDTDGPRGFRRPDGYEWFNESYLPHSHGYVSGIAKLEANFTLKVTTGNDGTPVDATVDVTLPEASSHSTGADGTVALTDLPLRRSGTVSVSWNGHTISRPLETLGGATVNWDVDFAHYLEVTVDVPASLAPGASATANVSVTNRGSEPASTSVALSSAGATLGSSTLDLTIGSGQTVDSSVPVTAGTNVMPFLVHARATASNATGTGFDQGSVSGGTVPLRSNLTDWTTTNGTWTTVDGGLQGSNPAGDAFAIADADAVGADFAYQADIRLTSSGAGGAAAALVFRSDGDPYAGSYLVNVSTENGGRIKLFKLPFEQVSEVAMPIDLDTTYRLKVVTRGDRFVVYLNGEPVLTAADPGGRSSGRFGLNTWRGTAVFQNVTVSGGLETNIGAFEPFAGQWTTNSDGRYGWAPSGDAFAISRTAGNDFTYEAQVAVNVLGPGMADGAGALVFRSEADPYDGSYLVNITTENGGQVKLFKLPYAPISTVNRPITLGQTYHLRVVADGPSIRVFFDGEEVIDVTDSSYSGGHFGLNTWQAEASFQSVHVG